MRGVCGAVPAVRAHSERTVEQGDAVHPARYAGAMRSLKSARRLSELVVDDEPAMAAVPLYPRLRSVVAEHGHFFVLPPGKQARWDRALVLNLTFWGGGGDVLIDDHVSADVVTHAAWHHLANTAFARPGQPLSSDALFCGEAIASAFDVYLVGTLLNRPKRAKRSEFLDTQVPAMAETAQAAGLDDDEFAVLLAGIAEDPARAFEDLRALLFDVTRALFAATDVDAGLAAMERFDGHRFAPLLHRFEIAGWVLWTRAFTDGAARVADPVVNDIDAQLRAAPDSLAWLAARWLPT